MGTDFLDGLTKPKKPKVPIFKVDWTSFKAKFLDKVHSHERENARRRRQIEKRMLRGAGLDQQGRIIE